MPSNPQTDWNSPLTREQADMLERLTATLSPEQARWVSGYLAGAHGALADGAPAPIVQSASEPAGVITILYGSETGNAEEVAEQARRRAEEKGLNARVIDMADYKTRELKNEHLLMIVTATHGEGDPPDPAEGFYEFLHGRKAPGLTDAKFAVLALGDSSYEHFCQTGKDLDARLEAMGAERIHARADCDVDYEETANAWIEESLDAFTAYADALSDSTSDSKVVAFQRQRQEHAEQAHDKSNPFPAEILDNVVLNGRGSDKEVRHVELSLEGSGIKFEPGDALCVVPENGPATVEELINALSLNPDDQVTTRDGTTTLEKALRLECEITTITPPFMEAWAPLTNSDALKQLVRQDNRKELMAYARAHQIVDVVADYPSRAIDAQTFVDMLRRLRPREYSIASSHRTNPDEVHLTVAAVRYYSDNGYREGVASSHLADRLEPGDTVPVYVQRNKNFKLPSDADSPIILIGPGTGVAPYRAFLEEEEELGHERKRWLVFGDRHFRTDFLYQVEWQRWLKDGMLTRMDVAFSRDTQEKVYVQHRMREQGHELFEWLEAGAYLYVCGDADQMAPDVHQALIDIVAQESGRTEEEAQTYVKELQRNKRYQRDVY